MSISFVRTKTATSTAPVKTGGVSFKKTGGKAIIPKKGKTLQEKLEENMFIGPIAGLGRTIGEQVLFPMTKEYQYVKGDQEKLKEVAPSFKKTPTQVAGEIGFTALSALPFLGIAGKAAKGISFAGKVARGAGAGIGYGAGFGATGTAAAGGTPKQIAMGAGISTGAGALLGAGATALSIGAGALTKTILGKVKNVNQTKNFIETLSEPSYKVRVATPEEIKLSRTIENKVLKRTERINQIENQLSGLKQPTKPKVIKPPIPKELESLTRRNWEIGQERPFKFDPNSTKNEGRFRLYPVEEMQPGEYRSQTSIKSRGIKETPGIRFILGKTKDEKSVIQAIRFNKSYFTEEQAAQWWEVNKNKFEFYQKEALEIKPKIKPIPKELEPGTKQFKEETLKIKKQRLGLLKQLKQNKAELKQLISSDTYKTLQKAKAGGIDKSTQAISSRGIIVNPEDAMVLRKVRDLGKFESTQLGALSPIRAAEKQDQSLFGIVKKIFIEPAQKAINGLKQEEQQLRQEFLMRVGGIKSGSEENARVFQFAEGKLTRNQVSDKEANLAMWMRTKYDQFIDTINAQRQRLNLPLIPKRKDYITHIQKIIEYEKIFGDITKIPDEVLLASDFTKPNTPFFRFMMKRTTDIAEQDAIGAFNAYIEPYLRQKYLTEPIAIARAHIPFLPQNSQTYWNQWVNEALVGKTAQLDRTVFGNNKVITRLLDKVRRMTGKGSILGNVTTTVLQPTTFASTWSKTGKWAIKSIPETFSKEGQKFAERWSKILRGRKYEIDIDPTKLRKFERAVGWANETLDRQMVVHSFLSAYQQGIHEYGLAHKFAVRYADLIAGKTQAIYDKMFLPPILRSKLGGALGQFQTFTYNLYEQVRRDIPLLLTTGASDIAFKETLRLATGMVVIDIVYNSMGLPTPYDLRTFIPFSGAVKFGPSPVFKTVTAPLKIVFGDEETRTTGIRELKRAGVSLIPAGNQLLKTVEGMQAVQKGAVQDKRGNILYNISSLPEMLRTLVFGKYGSKAAKEYFKSK